MPGYIGVYYRDYSGELEFRLLLTRFRASGLEPEGRRIPMLSPQTVLEFPPQIPT